jgi:hypothetical protein
VSYDPEAFDAFEAAGWAEKDAVAYDMLLGRVTEGRWLGVLVDAIEDVGVSAPADVPAGPPFFRFADDAELTQLLTGAGLADPAVETVEFPLEVRTADELWDGLIAGAVRMRAVVHAQSEDVQCAIRARFDELLQDHAAGDGFEVSVSVKLGVGKKP